jgi:hypothetical protein
MTPQNKRGQEFLKTKPPNTTISIPQHSKYCLNVVQLLLEFKDDL